MKLSQKVRISLRNMEVSGNSDRHVFTYIQWDWFHPMETLWSLGSSDKAILIQSSTLSLPCGVKIKINNLLMELNRIPSERELPFVRLTYSVKHFLLGTLH